MKKFIVLLFLIVTAMLLPSQKSYSQNFNSSRSNRTRWLESAPGWSFGASTGSSFALKKGESTLFRTNSMATNMFGRYQFGAVGLGVQTGILPGAVDQASISSFIASRRFPTDAIANYTKSLNAYMLFGPSFSFGHIVQFNIDLGGGLFYNNSGSLLINQPGASKALYRFDAASKNLFPGFSGALSIAYPLTPGTKFILQSNFLQSSNTIRLLDPTQGIDVAIEQNRKFQLFTAGIGIVKSFHTTRDAASGMSTGRRATPRDVGTGMSSGRNQAPPRDVASGLPTGRRIVSPRDPQSGLPTGQRILSPRDPQSGLPTGQRIFSPRDPQSGLPTGQRSAAAPESNCGPVTLRTTSPDGTIEEKTFSCPADAASYAKQTQGATFGEKVNQGLHAAGSAISQGAGAKRNNIIAGIVHWSASTSNGIVTNKSAGTNSNTGSSPTGTQATFYARDPASGLATGRRQYQKMYVEGQGNNCTDCALKVSNNPLYKDNGKGGDNPLYKGTSRMAGGDNDCDGIAGIKVNLIDLNTKAIVATTETESCGAFYFANVPSGNYAVYITGSFDISKEYEATLTGNQKNDVAGELRLSSDLWSVEIITAEGNPEDAPAILKSKTKSNQSNDRQMNNGKAIINTSRSNIKNMAVSLADVDGDGTAELWIGNSALLDASTELGLLGGALPGGQVISAAMRPGNPIGGISIKGGKNPGGQMRTTQTNEFGEFEFTDWEPGSYKITSSTTYQVSDITTLIVGDLETGTNINTTESNLKDIPPVANKDGAGNQQKASVSTSRSNIRNRAQSTDAEPANNIVTSESNLKGDVKITASQNSQSLRINGINGGMPNRISMNVTVPKQTQGASFGERVSSEDNNTAAATRAQNNNTVRSNRTDNAIVVADLDGDGTMETTFTNVIGEIATLNITEQGTRGNKRKETNGVTETVKTQIRMAAPPAWVGNDGSAAHVHGDPHVDQKDGTLYFQDKTSVPAERWTSSPISIKQLSYGGATVVIISGKGAEIPDGGSLNGLPPGQPVVNASILLKDASGNSYLGTTNENGQLSFRDVPKATPHKILMNISFIGTDDLLLLFTTDEDGTNMVTVLKTKHDTVKNSISNVR